MAARLKAARLEKMLAIPPSSNSHYGGNGAGTGQGAILDGQYLLDAANPALAGSTAIQIYCTGLGPVTNQPQTGNAAFVFPLSETITRPSIMIGGVSAPLLFSGLAPGNVGLYQVHALVPARVPSGNVPVMLTIGGVTSNVVTIAVK